MLVINSSNGKKRQANAFTATTNSYNVTEQIIPFMRYQLAVVACNELGCGDLELAQPSVLIQTQPDSKCSTSFHLIYVLFLECSSHQTSKLFSYIC